MNNKFVNTALMKQTIGILRDETTEPKEFRHYLRQLGTYLAYESSKIMSTRTVKVKTPVMMADIDKIADEIVVISLLRAAMPMSEAILEQFPHASYGVVSASRAEMISNDGSSFNIKGGYTKIPKLDNKIAIIVDPMLATGSTLRYLLKEIKLQLPKQIFLIVAIASEYGISIIEREFPDVEIFCGAIDKELNNKGYIVPGLGDAGDRVCNTIH